MSDDFSGSEFEKPSKPVARKRKSSTTAKASTSKKAKTGSSSSSGILNLESSVLATTVIANGADFYSDASNAEETGAAIVKLAEYTKLLEGALSDAATAAAGAPAAKKKLTKEQLEAAAEKIRKAAVSGMKKQMTWKPSCKTNSAKWSYDGICPDPEVFGCMMGLDGGPTWKMKKFSKEDFEDALGPIGASARYDDLCITSKEVNVRYSDSGEFKFSGSYGRGY